jgi:hypothetical protein
MKSGACIYGTLGKIISNDCLSMSSMLAFLNGIGLVSLTGVIL